MQKKWTCRFCGDQGVDPWLATHDCPAPRRWPDSIVSNEAIFRALHTYDAEAQRASCGNRLALMEPMRAVLREFAMDALRLGIDEAPVMRMSEAEVVDWGFKKMDPQTFVAFASERSSPSCTTLRGSSFWQRVAVLARKRAGLLSQ